MLKKASEIINTSTPDAFLYELYGIKKNHSDFYQEDGNGCLDPFVAPDCFETAKEVAEFLYDEKMCDEDYAEYKAGFRCERYALHKMNDEVLEEIKNSILEEEFIYTQEQYDEKLNWAKEHSFFPHDPRWGEKAFPYRYLTEEFVNSWDYKDLLKYCEYNNKFYVGVSCLCEIGDYKNFGFVYDCETGDWYFGRSDYDRLEDYTPAEDFEDEDDDEDDNED